VTRKRQEKWPKIPRKKRVRRSATKEHRNKYADKSQHKHSAYGVLDQQ
jgi:hypothetical protein